jgi:radial spoke head protein 1
MADAEEQPPYILNATSTGKVQHRSRDFSGHATAKYPVIEDQPRETYVGDFQDGIRSGQGVYTYSSGSRYKGGWKENRKSGLGRAKLVTKTEGDEENPRTLISEYHGDFLDGLKHGQGSYRYSNGDIYSGGWLGGKKHGQGTYFFAKDESTIVGVWKAGAIETGAWTLRNGVVWTGTFALGQPKGVGLWTFLNEESVKGEFVQETEAEELEANEDGSPNVKVTLKGVKHLSH